MKKYLQYASPRYVALWALIVCGPLALCVVWGNVNAQPAVLTGCAAKTDKIERELDAAQRRHADRAQIAGLRVALVKSKTCDERALARERAAKVEEKRRKARERREALDLAIRDNRNPERIDKAKHKLAEAEEELNAAILEQHS